MASFDGSRLESHRDSALVTEPTYPTQELVTGHSIRTDMYDASRWRARRVSSGLFGVWTLARVATSMEHLPLIIRSI